MNSKNDFFHFQIEKGENCIYDFLEVFDGHSEEDPAIGRFCGYETPTNVKSSSNRMMLKFVSDSSVEKAGFSLHFIKGFKSKFFFGLRMFY